MAFIAGALKESYFTSAWSYWIRQEFDRQARDIITKHDREQRQLEIFIRNLGGIVCQEGLSSTYACKLDQRTKSEDPFELTLTGLSSTKTAKDILCFLKRIFNEFFIGENQQKNIQKDWQKASCTGHSSRRFTTAPGWVISILLIIYAALL